MGASDSRDERADVTPGVWREPTSQQIHDNERLYEIAYDESKRALDDQSSELSNIRTRTMAFLAFTGAAAAFLAGTGVNSAQRGAAFYTFAVIAYALALLVIVLVALVLNPWFTVLYKRVEAATLVTDWIERDIPVASRADMLRDLALTYDEWRAANEKPLMRVRWLYVAAISCGGTELVAWSVLVWVAR